MRVDGSERVSRDDNKIVESSAEYCVLKTATFIQARTPAAYFVKKKKKEINSRRHGRYTHHVTFLK